MNPLSYSPCAHLIVSLADKRSFLFASCCNVLVVNGGTGLRVDGFFSILETNQSSEEKVVNKLFTFSSPIIKDLFPCFNLPVCSSKSEPLEILCPFKLNNLVSKVILSFTREALIPQ